MKYYLGLDMGSSSVGWAVTDEKYRILRAKGKALWGVRLFGSADTAEKRRTFRTARRRLDRRNWRIELLQSLFAEEINKIDEGFFLRMKESRYWPEDKKDMSGQCPELPYALFVDKDYTDKEYHRQFPTIYHLRRWLMDTKETPDVRLLYLALHHLMKRRGHFLLSGNIENIREFEPTFRQFLEAVRAEELGFLSELQDVNYQEIENILKDNQLTRSTKKSRLIKSTGASTASEKELMALISGCTVKLSSLFGDKQLDESEKPKLSFADTRYEEYAEQIQETLGEQYAIIEYAKAVYDWAVLADILGSYRSISEAKVAAYEKHKADLKYLKKLVKENLPASAYRELFVSTDKEAANYCAYIGMAKKNGKKQALEGKRCSREEFYAYLKKKVLSAIADEEKTAYLKNELEMGTFLPKAVTKENSVIPYQIHLYELNAILSNLQDRVPLLREQGDKIREIFTFRIPYYVGPLNGIRANGKETNWVKREQGKIYPWNFHEMVDIDASAERFIRRMTNKCTYLIHEDVLPKHSLLYSKYTVLNELNNLRLNGEPVSVEQKQAIYQNLFQRYRKVTQKRLKDYLVREGIADRSVDITGIDGDFKNSLAAYHDFKEKLTGVELSQEEKENIILNVTLFGEDKSLLRKRLHTLFPQLSDKQLSGLCKLSYSGWGRFSRAFLEGIAVPVPGMDGESTIIRALWETNENLMQLLGAKHEFSKAVKAENGGDESREISYQLVQELYVSPAVRRQIWQALLTVKEVCKVLGNPPERVFMEMAREKTNSGRTESRKNHLLELYRHCKAEERAWMEELSSLEETELRRDRLYLYYTQKGRCMYSGEVISFSDLWDNNKYDIDHIYPQSKLMDDSLDNRVLVKRIENEKKADFYPIKFDVKTKMRSFWGTLLNSGFISKEKYKRLVRNTEFEPSELSDFIARQLVETRQGSKAAASILKQVLPDTEVVYVKAATVAQFRQDFEFLKVREMNDLHHAKDAYLNIVVGNVYFVKFTSNPLWYVREYPGRSYNLKKLFTADRVERNGETAWLSGEAGSIVTVRRTMEKNNILVTRRSAEGTGALFKEQPLKKGKGQVPVKGADERLQDIEKYGGYNDEFRAYFVLVESDGKKGEKKRTIEHVPIRLKDALERDEEKMRRYLEEQQRLKNPRILLDKIKVDTLFQVDGFYMYLSSRTDNRIVFKGGMQLLLPWEQQATLKKIIKFINRRKENKNIRIYVSDKLTEEMLEKLYEGFLDKLRSTVYRRWLQTEEKALTDKKGTFMKLSIEEKCLVLYEILHMFQCQSGNSNLKLIGGSGKAGILRINKNITKCESIKIINQSPTGLYEQVIDLKKL